MVDKHTNKIVQILMERDDMSEDAAWEYIHDVAAEINETDYEELEEVLANEFGLEPDYIFDLIGAIEENPCAKGK